MDVKVSTFKMYFEMIYEEISNIFRFNGTYFIMIYCCVCYFGDIIWYNVVSVAELVGQRPSAAKSKWAAVQVRNLLAPPLGLHTYNGCKLIEIKVCNRPNGPA